MASRVLGMPVRIREPSNLTGSVDKLQAPAYATSVGLAQWAVLMSEVNPSADGKNGDPAGEGLDWQRMKSLFRRFLP